MTSDPRPPGRPEAVLLIAACGLAFFWRLGGELPIETAEARVPVAARSMARSGLAPIAELGGEPWRKKPPLAVWMQAASMRAFGETLFAAALPAALLSAATVWAVARRGGLLAGLILLLCPRFLLSARGAEMDIIFACLTALAILAGLDRIAARGRVGWSSQVLLGLAILAKGPLCLAFAAFAWGRGWLSPWLPLVVLPAAAWLAWAMEAHPGLVTTMLSELQKGIGDDDSAHARPFYDHLATLAPMAAPAMVPILALGLAAVLRAWKRRRGALGPAGASSRRWLALKDFLRADPARARLLACFAGGLVLLSALTKKQTSYVLPLYPALALLAAGAARALEGSTAVRWAVRGGGIAILAVAIGCGVYSQSSADAIAGAAAGAAACLWAWKARGEASGYRNLLIACVPVFALGVLPAVQSFRAERSLVRLGWSLARDLEAASPGSAGRVAFLGRNGEIIAWGYGDDLPRAASAGEARARGHRFLIRMVIDPERDAVDLGFPVFREDPHPKHQRRRLQVLDLRPATASPDREGAAPPAPALEG
jgi:hypothetical protein